jgi:hypothetical protein
MAGNRWLVAVFLAVASGFLGANTAAAGPILTWLGLGNDPPPSYSPAHFWMPGATRLADDLCGPRAAMYAPDRHPEIPPTCTFIRSPISPVSPEATLIERPSPPATSRAR